MLGLGVWNGTSRLRNIRWLSTGRTAPSIYSYILERYTHVNNLLFTHILYITHFPILSGCSDLQSRDSSDGAADRGGPGRSQDKHKHICCIMITIATCKHKHRSHDKNV